jgi:phosphoglycolate phosphatase
MNWKLAIFDFDGTLADSAAWFRRQLNPLAQRFGFRQVGEAELEELRGLPNREIVRRLEIPFWRLPAIARHMRALAARDAESIALFDGIGEMLAALNGHGMRLAVVSSNAEANVRRILGPGHAALIDHYDCGAALFGKAKKLRSVARRAGVPPDRVIVIGDETRDIEAARAAGMDSAAVGWGYATPEALAEVGPTLACASVDELVARLSG